jgi:hypothetical protein
VAGGGGGGEGGAGGGGTAGDGPVVGAPGLPGATVTVRAAVPVTVAVADGPWTAGDGPVEPDGGADGRAVSLVPMCGSTPGGSGSLAIGARGTPNTESSTNAK